MIKNSKSCIFLSRDYHNIVFIIISFIIIILSFSSGLTYISFIDDEEEKIEHTSKTLNHSLSDIFFYANHLMGYYANQIRDYSENDIDYILKLLGKEHNYSEHSIKNLFSWTKIDWIDQNDLLYSSLNHMREKNFSVSHREYIALVKKKPGTIKFSAVAKGIPSGKLVIPSAFGVVDKSGKYIGAIGIGFEIEKIKSKLENEINFKDIDYLMLDENHQKSIILNSNLLSKNFKIDINLLTKGFLNKPVIDGEMKYIYYEKLENFPFSTLVGYNQTIRDNNLKKLILKRVSGIILLGTILITVLFSIRKFIILPLVNISKAAEKIISSDASAPIEITDSSVGEINIIGDKLYRLNSLMKKSKLNEIQISERNEELAKALNIKTDFLNNMSHEVRTPIHGFMCISEGLVEDWDSFDDKQKYYYVKKIAQNAKRLQSLVGHLLDLSKFNEGKIIISYENIDLVESVRNIIEEANSLYLIDKKIYFDLKLNGEDFTTRADKERISQVIRNLFVNAIKFSPDGSNIKITLSIYQDDSEYIYFEIEDQGVGIPKDDLELIFDVFMQSSRTKHKPGGSGLGLTICRKIINAHNGKIWAESKEGEGAIFKFIIPLIKVHSLVINSNKNKNTNIMIIDDEDASLTSMSIILSKTNFRLVAVENGYEAFSYLRNNPGKIKLILLDMMMPGISGIEFLEQIKKDHDLAKIPVILQTGWANENEILRAKELGVIDYIKKPYQKNLIIYQIEKTLQKIPA